MVNGACSVLRRVVRLFALSQLQSHLALLYIGSVHASLSCAASIPVRNIGSF